jgi:hypothetical protein
VSALAPGLYRATVRGVADVVVMVDGNGVGHMAQGRAETSGYINRHVRPGLITDARPLIVLDLHPSVANDLAQSMRDVSRSSLLTDYAGVLLRKVADQIEAQVKPARIPEPDKGEFVRAHLSGMGSIVHFEFVRPLSSPVKPEDPWHWVCTGDGNVYQWDALIDPVLDHDDGIKS